MNNKKLLHIPEKAQQNQLKKYVVLWMLLGFLIGSIVALFSIPMNDYALVMLLQKISPGIDIWTNGTIYKDVAITMWIYATYSVPLVICIMIKVVKRVTILMPLYCTLILPLLAYIFTSVLLTGRFLGVIDFIDSPENESGIYWSFYSESVLGAVLMPISIGLACVIVNFSFVIYIIKQFKLRKLWEKGND